MIIIIVITYKIIKLLSIIFIINSNRIIGIFIQTLPLLQKCVIILCQNYTHYLYGSFLYVDND